MGSCEYRPSGDGMKELLGSDGVLSAVVEAADTIRANAVAMVSDDAMDNDAFYSAGRIDGKGMARASVYTGNSHGMNACLSDNVLLKAIG